MSTAPFIPFVRSALDESLASELYDDAPIWRITLERPQSAKRLPTGSLLWIDCGFDGVLQAFENADAEWGKDWLKFVNRHGELNCLADAAYLEKPERKKIEEPIRKALAEADALHPSLISIPQLPYVDGTERNKINKLLFQITLEWHVASHSKAKLILPVIFTHSRQLNKKTDRNPKVKFVAGLLTGGGVNAVWSVDASLDDQCGTSTLARERFPGIVDFFKELRSACSLEMTVAGPYWGLGLVLWSRGLVSHFGVGLGSTFRYHIPGGMAHGPKARVAPECLRRWVSASADLREWLLASAGKLPAGSPAQAELKSLAAHFPAMLEQKISRRQIARAHKNWCKKINAVAPSGRAVALFQDLSSAFVTGKALDNLPDDDGPCRRPELIAEQLMLNCL